MLFFLKKIVRPSLIHRGSLVFLCVTCPSGGRAISVDDENVTRWRQHDNRPSRQGRRRIVRMHRIECRHEHHHHGSAHRSK